MPDHNNQVSQTHADLAPERREFLDFLDSEINNLQAEVQRPGWTIWAILGSTATLVWLLLSQLESHEYSSVKVIGILIVSCLLFDFASFIKNILTPSKPSYRREIMFISHHRARHNSISWIMACFKYITLLIFVIILSNTFSRVTTVGSMMILSLFLLSYILAITFVLLKFPIVVDIGSSEIGQISIGFLVIAYLTTIISIATVYLDFLFISPGGATFSDVKLALLLASTYYLLFLLFYTPPGNLMLDSLIMIRRELCLGKTDLAFSIRQADMTLLGYRISDVLEEYISKILSLYRDANTELENCSKHLELVKSIVFGSNSPLTLEKKEQFTKSAKSITKSLDTYKHILTTLIPKAFVPIRRRIFFTFFSIKDSSSRKAFLDDLFGKMDETRAQLDKRFEEFSNTFTNFKASIENQMTVAKEAQ